MVDAGEELEPLFDYHRVQPASFVCLDDDETDASEAPAPKKAKTSETVVLKADEDVKVVEVTLDEDWLPPPPKVIPNENDQSGEDSTIKALRLKKQELLSFTNTAKDMLQEVEEYAKAKVASTLEAAADGDGLPKSQSERAKIVISIQDKDGQKQFRVYADEKFERLFKLYADRAKADPQSLVFCFDGDKINPSATPAGLGMEDDDMIEVHMKKS